MVDDSSVNVSMIVWKRRKGEWGRTCLEDIEGVTDEVCSLGLSILDVSLDAIVLGKVDARLHPLGHCLFGGVELITSILHCGIFGRILVC